MMEWQPIETAPKDDINILVFYDSGEIELLCSSDYEWQPYTGFNSFADTPTHWTPLPDPPKTEE